MSDRLARVETLILSLTILAAVSALACGISRPLGIAIAGSAALLDFVLIRHLAAAALAHRPPVAYVVPLAIAKSVVLMLAPALALLLPSSVIDGVSFAVGVSTLPAAIVIDALIPAPMWRT